MPTLLLLTMMIRRTRAAPPALALSGAGVRPVGLAVLAMEPPAGNLLRTGVQEQELEAWPTAELARREGVLRLSANAEPGSITGPIIGGPTRTKTSARLISASAV